MLRIVAAEKSNLESGKNERSGKAEIGLLMAHTKALMGGVRSAQ